MKRLHLHIITDDLNKSVAFYTAMFGEKPSKREDDYAKWLLDDPRANISVSTHCGSPGVDHAGISIETREELNETAARLRKAGVSLLEEDETTCCYAQSNKFWAKDPQGAQWELFQTFGGSEHYGADPAHKLTAEACC